MRKTQRGTADTQLKGGDTKTTGPEDTDPREGDCDAAVGAPSSDTENEEPRASSGLHGGGLQLLNGTRWVRLINFPWFMSGEKPKRKPKSKMYDAHEEIGNARNEGGLGRSEGEKKEGGKSTRKKVKQSSCP